MTSPSDDCYFYYYSTCSKGDACPFRHCAEALGSETTCVNWSKGFCARSDTCRYRHMEIKKDRSTIHCYWETQPGGCKKMHCAFKHLNRAAGDAGSNLPDPVSSSTPDATITKKILPQLDQEISTSSPKIDPVVFNPFEEDSDRESVGVCTPKKSTTKAHTLPPAKTGKIKLTKPEPDEKEGLNFEIKSLDVLKSEKIAEAKKILVEAGKLVSSQSNTEDDEEETKPETTSLVSSPGRVSAISRLGGSAHNKQTALTKPSAQPNTIECREDSNAQPAVVRRIIESSVDQDSDSDSASVEEEPRQKRIAVLKKAERPSSRRVNLNQGRRIIIADDEVKAEKPAAASTRRVSPKKGGVLSRIGPKTETAERRDVRSRIGNKTETGQTVKSRLGNRNVDPTDTTSLDELPGSDVRALQIEKAKLTAKLMRLEEMSESSDDPEQEVDDVKAEVDEAKQEVVPEEEMGIRSLEDIQREKALQSMKRNRRKKAQTVQGKTTESRTIRVSAMQKKNTQEVVRPGGETARSTTSAGKKRVLTTRKSTKHEQQIYKPPGAKLKQREAPAPSSLPAPSSSLRDRLGKRKVTPEKVSPSNHQREQGENTENVPQKKSNWGVKTFSEIMREKQQLRMAAKSNPNSDARNNSSNGENRDAERKHNGRKFTPIVFDGGDRRSAETTAEVKPAKRKYTPVVFDAGDNREHVEGRRTGKKFKPIRFQDEEDGERDESPSASPENKRLSSVIQKPQRTTDKTSPSPRRQLSRQPSNNASVTKETTPPTGTVRKLKRRSSSQISEADTAVVKPRRRSSGAGRKSSTSEKAPAAPQMDDLDLLDDEFVDLLGDVSDVNESALEAHNDDDLLQEMEELLA